MWTLQTIQAITPVCTKIRDYIFNIPIIPTVSYSLATQCKYRDGWWLDGNAQSRRAKAGNRNDYFPPCWNPLSKVSSYDLSFPIRHCVASDSVEATAPCLHVVFTSLWHKICRCQCVVSNSEEATAICLHVVCKSFWQKISRSFWRRRSEIRLSGFHNISARKPELNDYLTADLHRGNVR